MSTPLTSTVTWRPIDAKCNYLPPVEDEVLVYDGYLDDVVKAHLEYDGDDAGQWIEVTTDEPLPNPQFWTDVPFPGVDK